MIRQDAFQEVILGPTAVRGTAKAGTEGPPKIYEAVRPEDPDLLRELEARIRYRVEAQNPWMFYLLSWVVPILLLFFLWRFFIGRAGGVDRNLMAIGRSKAKVYVNQHTGVTFDDVAGVDEAKEELHEIIDFLRKPRNTGAWAVKSPRACSWWARRAPVRPSGQSGGRRSQGALHSMSGSEFVEMFVGVGAARVRDLFAQAQERAPCIILTSSTPWGRCAASRR